jgi:pilus assembly protein CpaF
MSRVNVVLPPIAAHGPAVTIRKMYRFKLTVEDLLRFGTWDEAIVTFLRACVGARLNLIVAGGTNSGKTTVLNNVIGMIPPHERVITVENAVELQPPPSLINLVRLESRPPDADGRGEVTIQSLIVNAMRMRPDRLVLGEVRSSEALDILQAINTGHEGTLFSIHANGPRDALMRLETMCAMHPIAFPLLTIRHMIADAINVIVYQERLRDGRRRVVKIAEVLGMQGDSIALNDIFEYRQTGVDGDGHITGYFTATGATPAFLDRIKWAGISLPEGLFAPR